MCAADVALMTFKGMTGTHKELHRVDLYGWSPVRCGMHQADLRKAIMLFFIDKHDGGKILIVVCICV